MRGRLLLLVLVVEALCLVAHAFGYYSWVEFVGRPTHLAIAISLCLLLAVSFPAASLMSFRTDHPIVRVIYKASAAWLGVLLYLLMAAAACWVALGIARLDGRILDRPRTALILGACGLAVGFYGIVNACVIRTRRVAVRLRGLPVNWQGRTLALVTDTHLGHVRGAGLSRRLVNKLRGLQPEAVLIGGDLFDGTPANYQSQVEAWSTYAPPRGKYFVPGNHEGFMPREKYLQAVRHAGMHPLIDQKVEVDGLQIVGTTYGTGARVERLQALLQAVLLDPERASILLTHAPDHPELAAAHGIGLQLSGHTHAGQMFPFTRLTRRVYGPMVYGLQRLNSLQVYTSSGAGTWGPPLRVGTAAEIVLIRLEDER